MRVPAGWYVIAATDEVKSKPLAVKIFEKDLVLWRDREGLVTLQEDMCPHRSAKLSLGQLHNGCIQCPFHGFEFDTTGSCTHVPETGRSANNLKVQTYSVIEQNGFIWFHTGDQAPTGRPPWFAELDAGLSAANSIHEWPTHITRCIENQLDYAHLPYVHKTSIGHNADVRSTREVDYEDGRIQIYLEKKTSNSSSVPSIQFIFPNLWLLTILPGRFYQFIAFVPVAENTTRIYLNAYHRFSNWKVVNAVLNPILRYQNAVILNQDRRVVLSQEPIVSTRATHEKLFPSDKAIAKFRELWTECVAE